MGLNNYNKEMKVDDQNLVPQMETSKSNLSGFNWGFWTVFSSTFLTILLAEMGDKTQLTTLLLAAESGSPWIVFLGAALALISTSLVGVLIGYWLSKKLTSEILDFFLALLLLSVSGLLIADVITI